jgi:hypothetical protein
MTCNKYSGKQSHLANARCLTCDLLPLCPQNYSLLTIPGKESRGPKNGKCVFQVDIKRQFGLQKATRTNNYHWTSDEVNQLVEGVATLGVGRWTELKSTFFPTSIRTAQHLKV